MAYLLILFTKVQRKCYSSTVNPIFLMSTFPPSSYSTGWYGPGELKLSIYHYILISTDCFSVNVYSFTVLPLSPCPWHRWLLGSWSYCILMSLAGGAEGALICEWTLVLLWKECSLMFLSLISLAGSCGWGLLTLLENLWSNFLE